VFSRKTVNKNPNCNHNSSSIFYNKSFSNIRYDDAQTKDSEHNPDLLWIGGEQYNEKDEIKSLKDLILRLFQDPHFGEKTHAPPMSNMKDATNLEDLYAEFDNCFGHEEILIDGYKINKYALWLIKRLNPHHKALIFALVEISKLPVRGLAKEILNDLIMMNNKWSKDWYIWVLTYMIVQTIKTSFDVGTKDLIDTIKKLIEYPVQPIKSTSIRALFPDKVEDSPILKNTKRTPGYLKTRKLIPQNTSSGNAHGYKKPFLKALKRDPEDIFVQKLRLYREYVSKQQKMNGLDINPYGNWRVLKYSIGFGNNSLLLQHALSSRWWWCKTKIKEGNYNFLWTQHKSKKFITSLKKHTEVYVIEQEAVIKTPELTKNNDNDLDTSRANESSEETATTPSSSKHPKWGLAQDKVNKKLSSEVSLNKRKQAKIKKPPVQCDSVYLSNHLEGHYHLSNKKALYYNMKTYYEFKGEDPFNYLPMTYHIKDGVDSEEFKKFSEEFKNTEEANLSTEENSQPKK